MRFGIASVGLVFAFGASAVAARADDVDKLVRDTMERAHIPGLALEVVRDGHVLRRAGYGYSNLETLTKVSPETIFEIGSATKQFTAAAVLLLQDRGQLSLDDTLGKYLKDIPEVWQALTIRQIMSHTAGLKDYLASVTLSDTKDTTPSKLIDPISKLPFDYEPGTGWAYSNTGFLLAGMVVEKVSGKPLETYLAEQFFKPLGMKTMTTSTPNRVVTNRAHGYSFIGKEYSNAPTINPTQAAGAGFLMGSVDDMVKWADSLSPQHLLSRQALDLFETPVKFKDGTEGNYSFGQFLDWNQGDVIVEHGGNTAGFSAELWRYPAKKLTIVILTNEFGLELKSLARQIGATFVPELDMAKRKPIRDPFPKLTLKLKQWLEAAAKSKVDKSILAPTFAVQLRTMRGLSMLGQFSALGKALHSIKFVDEDDRGIDAAGEKLITDFEKSPVPKPKAPTRPATPKAAQPGSPNSAASKPMVLAEPEDPKLPVPTDRYVRYQGEGEGGTVYLEIHWTARDQISWLDLLYGIYKPKPTGGMAADPKAPPKS